MRRWPALMLLLAGGCAAGPGGGDAPQQAATGVEAATAQAPSTTPVPPVNAAKPVPSAGADTLPVPEGALTALPPPEGSIAGSIAGSVELNDREQRIAVAAAQAPHIYVALQTNGSRPVSVIFAIDESRDGTPQDDDAIRITPEDGNCNPQVMRNFNFPEETRGKPTFSGDQLLRGVNPDQLPAFLAVNVTQEMLALGLVTDREQTRAHNICTRKLWETQLANPAPAG